VKKNVLAQLPSVDQLLKQPDMLSVISQYGVEQVKKSTQDIIQATRSKLLAGEEDVSLEIVHFISKIEQALQQKHTPHLCSVINATGVVLHTNLGRSNLSPSIQSYLNDIAFGYSNLEYDLEKGQRGSRYSHLTQIIQELTGAEDVLVVNNNAAAVLLALNTLANQQEIVVSRGELVEIGGSFRIPNIIELSGGRIKEVGTTNKTHAKDYKEAINEETGALLKVHTSNYRVVGFSETVSMEELVQIGHQHELPVMNDLGSGLLMDLTELGLSYEPTVRECLEAGCDIVTFSGDKLLGGPQAGIIVGKKAYIEKMKKNQLTRALRVDKMTIAALEGTLRLYLNKEQVFDQVPTLRLLKQSLAEIEKKAIDFIQLGKSSDILGDLTLSEGYSQVGGGSYPMEYLPTKLVKYTSPVFSAAEIERGLRLSKAHIITRVHDQSVYFDLRTVEANQVATIVETLKEMTTQGN